MSDLPEKEATLKNETQLKEEYLSPKELRTSGLLQEINRLFLHPRGLALALHVDPSGGPVRQTLTIGGIKDYRDEEEGVFFEPELLTSEKSHEHAERVAQMLQERLEIRKTQGCDENGVQPLGKVQ